MVKIPSKRTPTHPGEVLLEEYIQPLGLTQSEVAQRLNVPFQRINELVRGKRGVTPSTALRLSKLFRTTPDFWLNLQLRYDLHAAQKAETSALKAIKPIAQEA